MTRRLILPALTLAVLLSQSILLGACGSSATPTTAPAAATATSALQQPTQPPAATAVPPTPTLKGPTVGGTLVWARSDEPESLDPHKSLAWNAVNFIGATLVTIDPKGTYVPYLAESWKISEDGLTWDFTLRRGVKFHNGAELTAKDYAWTITRLRDPATRAAAGSAVRVIGEAEAVDDYTLRVHLTQPYFPFLYTLSTATLQPLSQAAVDKAGDQYGRQPMSVGPYKFKEWVTGERIVLERNPDFAWAPAFVHQGPYYIQTLEFRFITEVSTITAGLESGEIDLAEIEAKDLQRIKDTGEFQILESLLAGIAPYLTFPVNKPPFDDIRVRKAFNLAVDREGLIKVVVQGQGVVQYGPISPSVIGYWSGVEKIGYGFDLAQAKALMKDAGYTAGATGTLEKDGAPLKLTLMTVTTYTTFAKVAEVLKEQFKALGVEFEVQMVEEASVLGQLMLGDYQISVMNWTYGEAELLALMYHSSYAGGGLNLSQVKDPELDTLLNATRESTDVTKRQEAVNQAQKRIVEQAYVVPLYAPARLRALSNKVKDALWSQTANQLYLNDAYIASN